MAKKKCPAELNSKVVRISLSIYQLLAELAKEHNLTIAEALEMLITRDDHKAVVKPVAIIMPVTTARSTPVTRARLITNNVHRQRSMPVTIGFSREVTTNGHR